MSKIAKSKNEVAEKYQSQKLVKDYEKRRISDPIWGMAHYKEISIVNQLLKKIHPGKLLEIAPGTARISRNLDKNSFGQGYAVDKSPEMLQVTRNMLDSNKWIVKRGNAFDLDFSQNYFDMVITFRFIRHFELENRQKIYQQIKNVLKPRGYLIFEAFNKKMPSIAYRRMGIMSEEKGVYDEVYPEEKLREELQDAGFEVLYLKKYANHARIYYFLYDWPFRVFRKLTRLELLWFWRGLNRFLDLFPSDKNCYFEVIARKK